MYGSFTAAISESRARAPKWNIYGSAWRVPLTEGKRSNYKKYLCKVGLFSKVASWEDEG